MKRMVLLSVLSLLGAAVAVAADEEEENAPRGPSEVPDHVVFESLGSSGNAVDGWALFCPAGTHHAHFDVHDPSAGGPLLGILGFDYTTGIATIRRAPQGGFSGSAQLNLGSGEYDFYVFKTGGSVGATTNYDSAQFCHTATHVVLSDLHLLFQDQ
jgi:opacity protein-like surface antigen